MHNEPIVILSGNDEVFRQRSIKIMMAIRMYCSMNKIPFKRIYVREISELHQICLEFDGVSEHQADLLKIFAIGVSVGMEYS